jgi:hypothetical protein
VVGELGTGGRNGLICGKLVVQIRPKWARDGSATLHLQEVNVLLPEGAVVHPGALQVCGADTPRGSRGVSQQVSPLAGGVAPVAWEGGRGVVRATRVRKASWKEKWVFENPPVGPPQPALPTHTHRLLRIQMRGAAPAWTPADSRLCPFVNSGTKHSQPLLAPRSTLFSLYPGTEHSRKHSQQHSTQK